MADSIAGALFLLVVTVLLFGPAILLALGWRDLGVRNYERADTRATLAGMTSVGQFALVGFLALLMVGIQDAHPATMAAVAVPAAQWALSRVLHRSIRVRREADRIARKH